MSIDTLFDGYRAFIDNGFAVDAARYRQLEAKGQSPKIMVIACADSRVDPSTIFNAGPGELFVVRNVANVVPRYAPDGREHGVSAALEFAVLSLGVTDIVVMGHAQCGGVKALLTSSDTDEQTSEFIGPWMASSRDIIDRVMSQAAGKSADTIQLRMEEENIRLGMSNLMSFPWIGERVKAGKITLHGMHFGIARGRLTCLNPDTNSFETVPGAPEDD